MNEENKRERSGVIKSTWNRCVKTGSKNFNEETLNQLLDDSGWEGLNKKKFFLQLIYNYPRLDLNVTKYLYDNLLGKIK